MNQHTRPRHMPQKLVSQPMALVRAFDKSGNVRYHETLALAVTDHTQVGNQRGERIVGNLRPHRRDRCDQRRLAGIGQTDDTDVGQQSEFNL